MKISNTPFIVKFAFLTLITIVVWIGFDVYRALTTEPPIDVPEETLKQLDPNLDVDTLNQLQNRVYIPDEQIPEINIIPRNKTGAGTGEDEIFTMVEEVPNTLNEPAETATESGQEQ